MIFARNPLAFERRSFFQEFLIRKKTDFSKAFVDIGRRLEGQPNKVLSGESLKHLFRTSNLKRIWFNSAGSYL